MQGGDGVGCVLGDLGEFGQHAGLQGVGDGLEQRVFPGEMVVKRAPAYPGRREDRLDGGVVVSVLREQPGGDLVANDTGGAVAQVFAARRLGGTPEMW